MLSHRQKGLLIAAAYVSVLPMFRSGLRGNLNFWQWIGNHTVFGPPVEYVPAEDYQNAVCPITAINRKEG